MTILVDPLAMIERFNGLLCPGGTDIEPSLNGPSLRVNSLHHQAVDAAGEGLRVPLGPTTAWPRVWNTRACPLSVSSGIPR